MSFVTQSKTKRLLAIHGWSGTVLGLLLYVVIFTGAIVVFEQEIDAWSQGTLVHQAGLDTRIDHHFRVAAREVDRRYYEEVSIFQTRDGHMRYLFHTHETNEAGQIVEPTVRLTVDQSTGDVIERWEGLRSDQPRDNRSALSDFWVDLHVQLYLPRPYGLILVGVLGLMMMFAAVSGILIHKHLIRDVFLSPRATARLVGTRDLHVLSGSWGLPFAFILAFTGAFFGFATTVGLPAMSMIAFGGDQEALVETIIGTPDEVDLTPAPTAALDFVVRDGMERTGSLVRSIQITNYDSAGAKIRLNMMTAEGDLSGQALGFDGVSRRFEGVQPLFGQAPSLGSSLLEIIGPLHFGNFAGIGSRLVWLGMGLAMAYVSATGMLMWCKRREDQPLWQGFRHWIMMTVWGLPFAMLVSAVAYFVTLPAGDPGWWTPFSFFAAVALVIGLGMRGSAPVMQLPMANASLCIGLPLLRLLTGGASWSEALIAATPVTIIIDTLLVLGGLVLLRKARAERTSKLVQEPAE